MSVESLAWSKPGEESCTWRCSGCAWSQPSGGAWTSYPMFRLKSHFRRSGRTTHSSHCPQWIGTSERGESNSVTSRQQFAPLCDLHHTSMERMMLEEDAEEIRSFHACGRRDCTRVFRDSVGFLDFVEGVFDDSRSSIQRCPHCGSVLYLAEVNRSRKIETWECPQAGCDFSRDHLSPSGQ